MIKSISISGFKSIRTLKNFELNNINVIVGANGTGKSNFIDVFRLIFAIMRNGGLREYVAGTADSFLFGGQRRTAKIEISLNLGLYGYGFDLTPTDEGFLLLQNEKVQQFGENSVVWPLTNQGFEAELPLVKNVEAITQTYDAMMHCQVYHFHDTSKLAGVRRYCDVGHDSYLKSDGGNLAAFLYKLLRRYPDYYVNIRDAVRQVIPFFDDFILEPNENDDIRLCWRQKGLEDFPMRPYQFSDGALRFICLATALLQPNPPVTIIIDEPELGLHPEAIYLLAEMLIAASRRMQLIIATQSPALLDNFSLNDIVIARRSQGATFFERLKEEDYSVWLEDYSVGELWAHDVIHGGTSHE